MPCVYLPCPGGPTGNAWRNLIFSFFLFTLCVFVTLPLFSPLSLSTTRFIFLSLISTSDSSSTVQQLGIVYSVQVDWIAQLNQFKSKLHRLEFVFFPFAFKWCDNNSNWIISFVAGFKIIFNLFFQKHFRRNR